MPERTKSGIIVPKGTVKPKVIMSDSQKKGVISHSVEFKPVRADLCTFTEGLENKGFDHPRIEISLAESRDHHNRGIVRLTIFEKEKRTYLLSVDALMSAVYAAYAPEMKNFVENVQKARQSMDEVIIND